MGFRYRKSINLGGGFRINLSKSGVGYSWGTKGFRVTRTASGKTRKTYSIPGTGISYVDEEGSNSNRSRRQRNSYTPPSSSHQNTEHLIESADISQFKKTEIDSISRSIERTLKANHWGTILLWCTFLAFVNPVFFVLPLLGCILKIYAHTSGRIHLNYSFDAEKEDEYNRKIGAWQLLAEGEKEWQVLSEQFNSNTRVNAGAGRSLKREPCLIEKGCPYYICANVETIQIRLKNELLIILPDKVFIVRKQNVGTIDYNDFQISVSRVRFVEEEALPKDAQVIGQTWKYVNTNGTPDRRFKDNKQLPICLYGQVFLRSASGLNVEMQISNVQNAVDFAELIF